ncbi:hypothetical protein [Ruania halotolerans]|uniref:hypothetical protein n=1 Tax=Ruania halotolerans TaxID=2897773 RepID=UPI001E35ACAC|nr:hypothetical protein [Ruania halotolerans]UFU08228.1 hypothetical protein LQF10_09090 [Ruania halotolerans]
MDELRRAASEIYAVPPEEFVRTRDVVSNRLDAVGNAEAARRVRALVKPVRAAWALNVLTRRMPERVAQLVDLGQALREAHEQRDAAGLRELTGRRRTLVPSVVRELRALCSELGPDLSAATCTQVEETLKGALADESIEAAVLSGLLLRPLGAGGTSVTDLREATAIPGATGEPPAAHRPGSPLVVVPDAEKSPRASAASAQDRRAAAAEVLAAQRRVERLNSAAQRTQQALAAEQSAARRLRAEADELHRRALALEHDADRADRHSRRADRVHAEAVRSLEQAHEALEEARRAQAALE